MTQTPQITDRNLLAAIPFQLGYRPSDCVVFVSIDADHMSGSMLRVDLDNLKEGRVELVEGIVDHLLFHGAIAIISVIYSDEDVIASTSEARNVSDSMARVMTDIAAGCGDVPLVRMWLMGKHEFILFDSCGEDPFPVERFDIVTLSHAPIATEYILAGRTVTDSRDDLGQLPEVGEGAAILTEVTPEQFLADDATREGTLALWREVLERGPQVWPSPRQLAAESDLWSALAAGVHNIDTRDAMIVDATLPTWMRTGTASRFDHYDGIERAMDGMLDPNRPVSPCDDRVRRAVVALEIMAAYSAPDLRAPACTLLALFAWWIGNGTMARVRLDQVMEVPGEYNLARIVMAAVDKGIAPAWIAAESALEQAGNS